MKQQISLITRCLLVNIQAISLMKFMKSMEASLDKRQSDVCHVKRMRLVGVSFRVQRIRFR